jgi:hypothetical protein
MCRTGEASCFYYQFLECDAMMISSELALLNETSGQPEISRGDVVKDKCKFTFNDHELRASVMRCLLRPVSQ